MAFSNLDWAHVGQLIAVLLAAGLVAGFVAGLFGIGGGFVVVPALLVTFSVFDVESEIVAHLAIGTSLATIMFTSARSVHAHNKRGVVDWQVIRDWSLWLIVGAVLGILIAHYLDGRSLKWIFSIGVGLMGIHFMAPVLQPKKAIATKMPKGPVLAGIATFLGGFSALLGIGGGTIAVLVMTACGRSIHQAVATAAGFGFLIAVPGTIGFAILGYGQPGLPFGSIGYVNVIAVLAIAAMTYITAPLGARAAHSLNGVALKRVFGLYLVATSAIVLYNSFTT
mgnify:FL=1